jgi:hypothetical protein
MRFLINFSNRKEIPELPGLEEVDLIIPGELRLKGELSEEFYRKNLKNFINLHRGKIRLKERTEEHVRYELTEQYWRLEVRNLEHLLELMVKAGCAISVDFLSLKGGTARILHFNNSAYD